MEHEETVTLSWKMDDESWNHWAQGQGQQTVSAVVLEGDRQTLAPPLATASKPGGCTQPNISDPQHGQLATPLDGPGLLDSGLILG